MKAEDRAAVFRAINAKRFGAPSTWTVKGRPNGWHLKRPCTPTDAAMHDNGINDALMAVNEMVRADLK